ncbi:MAG: efflux RND transporter periplasmic adaptor subunit [Bacteroidales bacterium]|nr:efflux RND transporter periplasmic adaptor subunit [Bacteroidales bacterium]
MKNVSIFILLLVLASCSSKKEEQQPTTYTLRGDTIVVDDNSIIAPKLKTTSIKSSSHQLEMFSTGTVRAIPNFYAEIAPPFSGRVTKVYAKLGMKTQPGTPLFEMASSDFTEVQKTLLQAKSELKSAKNNLERQQDLHEHGVAALRDMEEAQTQFDMHQQEYDNAAANLKIYGVNAENFTFGQNLVVSSPIAGEVIVNDVVLGQYITDNDEPHVKIAQLNKVWVVGEVKEKDLGFITQLEEARITLSAYPDKEITGKIYHIDEVVDEDTRSVKVMIECENEDSLLKPGMYVSVKFIDVSRETVLVPAKSVLQYNDRSFVYVEASKGNYIQRFVETGVSVEDNIIITKGLVENESIVTEGAFYLLDAK